MLTLILMALRYLSARKLRTTLTTLAIVFGVTVIFGGNLALPGLRESLRHSLQSATETVDLRITERTGATFPTQPSLSNVAQIQGVRAVTGVLQQQITLPASQPGASGQITLTGVDPATITAVRQFNVSAGRFLRPGDRGVVVLPASMAAGTSEVRVGAKFPLITTRGLQQFVIVGLLADRGQQITPQMIVPLEDAQQALGQAGAINAIEIALAPNANRDAVGANVLRTLGDQFQLGAGTNEADSIAALNIGVAIFNLLGLLALFVGAFLILNTFRTVVVERRHDLAMLRAIGASRRQVTGLIVIESFVQGVIGTALGLVLGYGFAAGLTALMNSMSAQFITQIHAQVTLRLPALVEAIAFGLLATLLAAYFPARAAGKVSPLAALRPQTAAEVRRRTRLSAIIGLLISAAAIVPLVGSPRTAAAGALLVLLGLVIAAPGLIMPLADALGPLLHLWFAGEGDLAQGNLVRQPGRAAITASTLMIGLAMVVAVTAQAHSFNGYMAAMADRNFPSDLLLMPQSVGLYGNDLGADQRLAERLRGLPEVAAVGTLRYAGGLVENKPVPIMGIDPQTYTQVSSLSFTEGEPAIAFDALDKGRAAIANPIMATTFKLRPGDDITLQTATGPQTYHIVAIADNIFNVRMTTLFISQANLAADFHKTDDILLMLKLKPGADLQAARTLVESIAADYPQFSLRVTAEYRRLLLDQTRFALRFLYVLATIILIPSVLGLINTLTINVLERTREIGVVRAVGGSHRQIRRMVLVEALLLGSFGAALGTIAGVAMSYGFVRAFKSAAGFTLPYAFPIAGVIAAIVLGIFVALVASILPARNAARLDIIRALQYE